MFEKFLSVLCVAFCVALIGIAIPAVSVVSTYLVTSALSVATVAILLYAGLENLR